MIILKTENTAELIVKKSRFIAYAKKCDSISEVKELVSATRKEHKDANHVVHAAVVNNEFSFSDDREPKNTAGRPAFEVLKGSGISNICVLIVRYFGGTLLGTGGLVKAYGDATRLVLQNAETEEKTEKELIRFSLPYSLYESVKHVLASFEASDVKEAFLSEIDISALIKKDDIILIKKELSDISNGKISVKTEKPTC